MQGRDFMRNKIKNEEAARFYENMLGSNILNITDDGINGKYANTIKFHKIDIQSYNAYV